MSLNLRNKILFILLWIFIIVSFSLLALFVLYEANGYRVDFNAWRLEQTGLIYIDGVPKQVEVKFNNKTVSSVLPLKIPKILPGRYAVSVTKEGYSTWSKNILVQSGQAFEYRTINLYLLSPEIKETTRKIQADTIKNDQKDQSSQVIVKDNEIWYKEKLVTRFSESPKGAILTDDHGHIMFQLGKELRVIELDGANNTKIFDFPTTDPYTYALYTDKVIFVNNDKIDEVKIR